MRAIIVIAVTLLVMLALNIGIYKKEQIMTSGDTMLLELAPKDPRSLMQGDYMRLRYAIARNEAVKEGLSSRRRGYLIVKPDGDGVARFVRYDDGTVLAPGEVKMRYHATRFSIRITPDAFFFQEGHAEHYEDAKYGMFKVADNGEYLLTGLADAKRQRITVGNTPSRP